MKPRRIINLRRKFNGWTDPDSLREFHKGAFLRFENGAKEHIDRSILDIDLVKNLLQELQDGYNYAEGLALLNDDLLWPEIQRLCEVGGCLVLEWMKKQKEAKNE